MEANEGPDVMKAHEAAEALEEQADVMQLLGRLFYAPLDADELDAMSGDTFQELAANSEDALMAEGCNDIYRFLRRRNTATCQELRSDFTQTFLGVREYKGASAVPYESLYVCGEGEHVGEARLVVHRIYKEHRLKLGEGIDIPEDHLTFELEFLAYLARRCAERIESGDTTGALELLAVQEGFLEEHVSTWCPSFFDLAEKVVCTRFYEGVIKFAKAFLGAAPGVLQNCRQALQDEKPQLSDE